MLGLQDYSYMTIHIIYMTVNVLTFFHRIPNLNTHNSFLVQFELPTVSPCPAQLLETIRAPQNRVVDNLPNRLLFLHFYVSLTTHVCCHVGFTLVQVQTLKFSENLKTAQLIRLKALL